ncbi:MAG: hypothetical protein H6656_11690 [Ardenticatenaceae bacterium]|nr:hypothetical protein [Ardenticatenaceae bacterium]
MLLGNAHRLLVQAAQPPGRLCMVQVNGLLGDGSFTMRTSPPDAFSSYQVRPHNRIPHLQIQGL